VEGDIYPSALDSLCSSSRWAVNCGIKSKVVVWIDFYLSLLTPATDFDLFLPLVATPFVTFPQIQRRWRS
jgi:hypothetical protein